MTIYIFSLRKHRNKKSWVSGMTEFNHQFHEKKNILGHRNCVLINPKILFSRKTETQPLIIQFLCNPNHSGKKENRY
jgi:hypothetical protein